MADTLALMIDRSLLRQAADIYAIGADRRDKAPWRQVLAEECVIEGPGFIAQGRNTCLQSIDALDQMYRATRHDVQQQIATIERDSAVGETYCIAGHMLRDGEGWRFIRRSLSLDWTETRSVSAGTSTNQVRDMTGQSLSGGRREFVILRLSPAFFRRGGPIRPGRRAGRGAAAAAGRRDPAGPGELDRLWAGCRRGRPARLSPPRCGRLRTSSARYAPDDCGNANNLTGKEL